MKIGDRRWKLEVEAFGKGEIFYAVCVSKPQLPSSISYLPSSKKLSLHTLWLIVKFFDLLIPHASTS
ncbi:MAG: hypothetical protein FJ390_07280 [Verrucomicrobia bacterium]|nr:hypothetical protein [Verrucomicrobiota bacterium]